MTGNEKRETRIYNIIAEVCSFIIGSCEESFFVKFSCVSYGEMQRIYGIIHERISILFEPESNETDKGKMNSIRHLKRVDLDNVFFDNVEKLSVELKSSGDYFALMGLVQVFDEALEELLKDKISELQKNDFSVVLNTNRESTGIGLLPRCSCMWERKHRLAHSYNRMDCFLFNILLIENSILGDLIDKHFFLKNDSFPDLLSKRKLKIATTPLRVDRHFAFERFEEKSILYFRVVYDRNKFDEDNNLIWDKIIAASKNDCDIILFPELLGNPQTVSFVCDKLKALSNGERQRMPSMIILPSFSENKRNTVAIVDREGNVICSQFKQNPFRDPKGNSGYLEDITSNKVVNIFHFEGIGRITILICKDFLTTKYMEQLMRCFKLTLIIVPSFSTGSYDFRRSFDLCAHDDCNVVWINACAAFEEGKEENFKYIGYVRKRVSRTDDEAQRLCGMPICEGAFTGGCRQDCLFYDTIQGV